MNLNKYPNALPEFKRLNKLVIEICETGYGFSNDTVIIGCAFEYYKWNLLGRNSLTQKGKEAESSLRGALATIVFRLCAGLFNESEIESAEEILWTIYGDIPLKKIVEAWDSQEDWRTK